VGGIAIELLDGVIYLVSFMLPVLVYDRLTPAHERCSMGLLPKLPRRAPMVILVGVAVIQSAAVANALLLHALGGTGSGGGFQWVPGLPPYRGVLLMISTAIIPAFCEEFLFRGMVLNALRPYGKTIAVIGSAVLFGLMHGSLDQILYTTVGGVVLALATLEGGSLWIAVLIHLFNNLLSVVESVLYMRFERTAASMMYGILELLVVGGGLVCLAYLAAHRPTERETAPLEEAAPRYPVRGFLSAPMCIFVALSVAQMLLLLL
jgi:membrane protease YdiL (CAAX protease family)